ncbi:MAG: hypothetical protein WAT81_00980 [Candidatus Moraniibacteriota bacterium]
MKITHVFCEFDGRRVTRRGEDSPLAAYTALPDHHWLPGFITTVERALPWSDHPEDKEWRVILRFDYHDGRPRGFLLIQRTVYRLSIPALRLAPDRPITLSIVRSRIQRHLRHLM